MIDWENFDCVEWLESMIHEEDPHLANQAGITIEYIQEKEHD